MFRPFSNIPLPLHLLLVLLIIILRLPCFDFDYFQPSESLYGICAEKIVEGKALYKEVWYSGPPLLVWFYSIFTFLFGSWWLMALRLFTGIYIYYLAVYFGGWLAQYRAFDRYPFLAPVIMVLLTCSPWYALEMSNELFIILPLLIAYQFIIDASEGYYTDYQLFFFTGILGMLCILSTYLAIVMFISVLVLYLMTRRGALDEILTILGGASLTLGICAIILFLSGSLGGFIDMGVLYAVDLLRFEILGNTFRDTQGAFTGFLAVESLFVIFAIIGFTHFRLRYYSFLVRIRRIEMVMTIWLFAGLFGLLFSGSQIQLHQWVLIAPPLAFYSTKVFDIKMKKTFYPLLLIASFIPSIFIYISFWTGSSEPAPKRKNKKEQAKMQTSPSVSKEKLIAYFKYKRMKNGIWIMDFAPELYLAIGKPCATKYVDYRLAYQKFHCLPYASTHALISKVESDGEIFEEFQNNLPDYIIDKKENGLFPNIQDMYPGLFFKYKAEEVGGYKIYHQ